MGLCLRARAHTGESRGGRGRGKEETETTDLGEFSPGEKGFDAVRVWHAVGDVLGYLGLQDV